MTDRNSPEEIAKRASQPDPLVMYLIIRESLGMSVGKMCAQVGHASQMLLFDYISATTENDDWLQTDPHWIISNEHTGWIILFKQWLNTSFRKVVLRADDKEWDKLKNIKKEYIVVIDAGLTQVPSGSETCIGFSPMYKSEAQKTIIKKLQVLK